MSEELLKALMQLFGITARLDGVSPKERDIVHAFLRQQLNPQDVPTYLDIFEQYAQLKTSQIYEAGEKLTPVKVSSKMLRISTQINKELTQSQKVIVIVRILELVTADNPISHHEQDFVETIATIFNISNEEFTAIQALVELPIDTHQIHDYWLVYSGKLAENELHLPNLRGKMVFLRIPSLEMYMVKYLGKYEYYLNGVLLKPNQIAPFPTGSAIRGSRIESLYYSDLVSQFRKNQLQEPLSFEVKNVSYSFPNFKTGLHHINLAEDAGKLIGIMGASGTGKSTLLEILNGNLQPNTGKVLVNGIDIHQEKLEGVVGYVPQDDMLIEELTVYENIYYAAQLCFGDDTHAQIEQLVEKILTELGLNDIKDLQVGSPLHKIISGGQRKRLNIGLELLRTPSILFVDEPTSGLSSRDSENIMDLLKELTLSGKLVLVVIHQPSSNIFKMFDKLYILDVGGYPIYYGNPVEAVRYFKNATNQVNSDLAECLECGNVNAEQIFDLIETKVVNEYGRFTQKRKMSPQQWHELFEQNIELPHVDTVDKKLSASLKVPHRMKQTLIFFKRDLLAKLRNTSYLLVTFGQAPLLAFLLAFVARYYQPSKAQTYTFSENENIPVYIFIAIIVAIFMGLVGSVEEINRDRKILKRESFLNLSRNSYLISKVAILFIISSLQVLLLVAVGNYVLEIKGMFWSYFGVLLACACFANLLGLNVSSTFDSAVTIYVLIPLLLIPQLMLGGIVIQFDKMNPQMKNNESHIPWLGETMVSRWAFEALVVSQFKNNDYNKRTYHWDKQIALAEYKKVYFIPKLEELMQKEVQWKKSNSDSLQEKAKVYQKIIQNTFQLEQKNTSIKLKGNLEEISQLKKHYNLLQKKATDNRNSYWQKLKKEKGDAFVLRLREMYHNETLARLAKNTQTDNRVLLTPQEITTQLYPIFIGEQTSYKPFFTAKKDFFAWSIPTYWYNILVVFFMIGTLYTTLYFDFFRRLYEYMLRIAPKQDFLKRK